MTVRFALSDFVAVAISMLPALIAYALLVPNPMLEGPVPGGAVTTVGSRLDVVAAPGLYETEEAMPW
jgi:hypothetical protein